MESGKKRKWAAPIWPESVEGHEKQDVVSARHNVTESVTRIKGLNISHCLFWKTSAKTAQELSHIILKLSFSLLSHFTYSLYLVRVVLHLAQSFEPDTLNIFRWTLIYLKNMNHLDWIVYLNLILRDMVILACLWDSTHPLVQNRSRKRWWNTWIVARLPGASQSMMTYERTKQTQKRKLLSLPWYTTRPKRRVRLIPTSTMTTRRTTLESLFIQSAAQIFTQPSKICHIKSSSSLSSLKGKQAQHPWESALFICRQIMHRYLSIPASW